MRLALRKSTIVCFTVLVIAAALSSGLWMLTHHNLYLHAINSEAQNHSTLYNKYLNAKTISDLPANRLVPYKCLKHYNSKTANGEHVIYAEWIVVPSTAQSLRVYLWLDKNSVVRRILLCEPDGSKKDKDKVIASLARLLNEVVDRRLEPGSLIGTPQIQGTWSFQGARPVYNRAAWKNEARLVEGDEIHLPDKPYQLFEESTLVDSEHPGGIWFEWFTDENHRIQAQAMLGS